MRLFSTLAIAASLAIVTTLSVRAETPPGPQPGLEEQAHRQPDFGNRPRPRPVRDEFGNGRINAPEASPGVREGDADTGDGFDLGASGRPDSNAHRPDLGARSLGGSSAGMGDEGGADFGNGFDVTLGLDDLFWPNVLQQQRPDASGQQEQSSTWENAWESQQDSRKSSARLHRTVMPCSDSSTLRKYIPITTKPI